MEWELDIVVLVLLPVLVTLVVDLATGWGYIRQTRDQHV